MQGDTYTYSSHPVTAAVPSLGDVVVVQHVMAVLVVVYHVRPVQDVAIRSMFTFHSIAHVVPGA